MECKKLTTELLFLNLVTNTQASYWDSYGSDPALFFANFFLYYCESTYINKNKNDWYKKGKNICKYL